MKKLLISLVVVLFVALTGMGYLYKYERAEHLRTMGNQSALLTGVKHWKTKDSLNAVTIEKLTLSKKELKEHEGELVEELKDMGIKIKRLERLTQVGTQTKVQFKTVTKDSVVYLPGKDSIVAIKCMEYKDPWIDFVGCQDNVQLVVKDSLQIAAHGIPRKFWFIRYGTRAVNIDIVSKNPYTDITYAREIELRKRRKK